MARPVVAPALSTPDIHIFEDAAPLIDASSLPRLDEEQLNVTYEIQRTVDELQKGRWKRIALQFPDHMLVDAPRVFLALSRGLRQARNRKDSNQGAVDDLPGGVSAVINAISDEVEKTQVSGNKTNAEERLYILADTSYGACCVDEVAAEHAEAEVVVHYGRSCLSPTARLPVVYVFTKPPLDLRLVLEAFMETYKDREEKVIVMADITYAAYLQEFASMVDKEGYTNVFITAVVHNTASPLPNRTVPIEVSTNAASLQNYQLFHISDPPPSLLLTLSSRVGAIHIYPAANQSTPAESKPLLANSAMALRRRYALLTRMSTVPIIGILINTLSVKSYLSVLAHLKQLIASAGKKSYTFVVGKVNAAKVANFSEVGGWVVIGCWESSLFDSSDFWKPIITPWELELALKGDERRVWTGAWRTDFGAVLHQATQDTSSDEPTHDTSLGTPAATNVKETTAVNEMNDAKGGSDSEEESEPPEFDLRTGRYVSHSRPMGYARRAVAPEAAAKDSRDTARSESLIKRPKGDLATIGSEVSPAADFFRNQRSWQGLGSDFETEYDDDGALKPQGPAMVEQGRSGIARGYVVGDAKGPKT